MHTVGPNSTWTFFDRASAASTPPSRPTSSGSHVDPTAMPQGSDSERRPISESPRTPEGPSETLSDGMPSRSTAGRYHSDWPAVSEHFSSRVSAPSSSSMSATGPILPHHVSTKGRRPPRPAGPPPSTPPAAASACTKRARVAAGSMTSSISKCAATLSALPCS